MADMWPGLVNDEILKVGKRAKIRAKIRNPLSSGGGG